MNSTALSRHGWRMFCEKNQFDAEYLWLNFPGPETVERAEKDATDFAFSAERCIDYFKSRGKSVDGELQLITAQGVADSLQHCMDAIARTWE